MLPLFCASSVRSAVTLAAASRISRKSVAVPFPAPALPSAPAPREAVSLEGSAELEHRALRSTGEPWACGKDALEALALLPRGRQGASNAEDHARRLM
jgi:hypothetical protein